MLIRKLIFITAYCLDLVFHCAF